MDFYSYGTKLGIEIDGDSHFLNKKTVLKDKARDEFLFKKYKVTVIRFKNTEIKESLGECVNKIIKEIFVLEDTPFSSP